MIFLCNTTHSSSLLAKDAIFTHKTYGFTIQVPNSWIIKHPQGKLGDVPAIELSTPETGDNDTFLENINVMIGRSNQIADKHELRLILNRSLANLRKVAKYYRKGEQGETMINGKSAIWSIQTFALPGYPTPIKSLKYIIPSNNNHLFIITCTALPETFSIYEHDFRNIAKSFRLRTK